MILKLIAGLVLSITSFAAAFQYGGIKHDITSQVGTASAIIMNAASTQVQRVTGSTAQTIRLPDATTLRAGYWYRFVNENSATVTVQNSSSFTIGTVSGGTRDLPTYAQLYLTSNSTSGGPWTFEKPSASGGGGSSTVVVATKSAGYTMTNSDDVILCNGTITITMQSVASATSKPYRVKNIGTGVCTIARAGSDTFDGSTSITLATRYTAVELIPDGGTAWYVF